MLPLFSFSFYSEIRLDSKRRSSSTNNIGKTLYKAELAVTAGTRSERLTAGMRPFTSPDTGRHML